METVNNKKTIVQRLKKSVENSYASAEKYYSLLSTINDLKLTTREVQLVAFTAIKGNISYANIRAEFCSKYESSPPTINNMISKLKKMGILIKDGTKIKVNPVIILNFDNDLVLDIRIVHG